MRKKDIIMDMKKYIFVTIFSVFALTSSSCSNSDDDGQAEAGISVKCSPDEITAGATGGTFSIDVTSTGKGWTAYTPDTWMGISLDGTTADKGTITLSVSANKGTEARSGMVVVRSGTVRDTVKVSQTATIGVAETSVYAPSAGGTFSVGVSSNGNFTASADVAWIKATAAAGAVSIEVEPSNELKSRSGIVTVASSEGSQQISVVQESAPDNNISVPEGYRLVWNDEFDQGTTLNTAWWTHEEQGPGWVNNELQTYVDGQAAGRRVTEIADGKLSINCFKAGSAIYSGRVYANVSTGWKYGWFEARIKLPKGKGTWPAFWMMPAGNDFATNPWPRCGEIDIMEEVGADPGDVSSTIHCQKYNNTGTAIEHATLHVADAEDEFHVYACEWTPDHLKFYVDGKMILDYANDGSGVEAWPFDKPFYIILNLAWGGDWGGYKGTDDSALPATMKVDYVRVFQK